MTDTSSRASLNDVELPLTVVIGRTSLSLQDVAGLKPDAIVALAAKADEPLEICVSGKTIATGELCEGEAGPESLAIRILDINQDETAA